MREEGEAVSVALPVQWDACLWIVTVSSADPQRVCPSGKELYMFMESQMGCDTASRDIIFPCVLTDVFVQVIFPLALG